MDNKVGRIHLSGSRHLREISREPREGLLPLPPLGALHLLLTQGSWLVLGQAQRSHHIRSVPGSSTPLTAVTTSRCSRGKREALSQLFPSPSSSHLLVIFTAASQNAHDCFVFSSCG